MPYIDGNRLFKAKPGIRFSISLPAARRAHRVHPGAPCLTQRIPYRNRPHLVPPKTEQSTPAHALDWEVLFHLTCRARNGRIVENRDTGKFGNGFFEQLQPLPA